MLYINAPHTVALCYRCPGSLALTRTRTYKTLFLRLSFTIHTHRGVEQIRKSNRNIRSEYLIRTSDRNIRSENQTRTADQNIRPERAFRLNNPEVLRFSKSTN